MIPAVSAARRLATWGADVAVVLAREAEEMQGMPPHQLAILHHIEVPVHGPGRAGSDASGLRSADLIVDAVIGYSLRGASRSPRPIDAGARVSLAATAAGRAPAAGVRPPGYRSGGWSRAHRHG